MGRWGYRLFEGEQDFDIAKDLGRTFSARPMQLSEMVRRTEILVSRQAFQYYKSNQYKAELSQTVTTVRNQLDTGLGDRFFEKHRARESSHDDKYRVILAGALMMRAGARINPEHIQHIRELVPQIKCTYAFTLPVFDTGFREPGRAQLLAALDNYVAGTPRSFQEPSCFNCGKIQADLGFAPKRCGRCRRVWYCSEACQRAQWFIHKKQCLPPSELRMLNV
ncbi:unnamed protein product [Clonostachys solani]|uniref:MYND-type domain-containing protein n=1 Tax=Clonostachys solani TaxID=160281 RepID=A0A9N9VZZ5_9HYPO|nr:unnamed protein product [Clonostachys solani]